LAQSLDQVVSSAENCRHACRVPSGPCVNVKTERNTLARQNAMSPDLAWLRIGANREIGTWRRRIALRLCYSKPAANISSDRSVAMAMPKLHDALHRDICVLAFPLPSDCPWMLSRSDIQKELGRRHICLDLNRNRLGMAHSCAGPWMRPWHRHYRSGSAQHHQHLDNAAFVFQRFHRLADHSAGQRVLQSTHGMTGTRRGHQ
jgi:hypothetical protein